MWHASANENGRLIATKTTAAPAQAIVSIDRAPQRVRRAA